ncbi:FkbM family methyltransferase [Mycobacterium yunnanensis]|uniref:FkbM family methyltransferase n=1 Tax=Mycobacterium yunnanensis TaxID=368477 RepID=A0A9X2Z398_9MYCO|nr:FkbM family methyltransferase [Mycobacterium yunnanensis]MCV7421966.1 FkbM family methyltransferase [Mycobacterium yunnanensis]
MMRVRRPRVDGALIALRLSKLSWLMRRRNRWTLLRRGVAPSLEHDDLLAGRHYETVVDVGANLGQFAIWAVEALGARRIVCVDPLPDVGARLSATAAQLHDCHVEIVNAALGSRQGSRTLHITAASDSSSLLAVAPTQGSRHALREVASPEVDVLVGDDALLELAPLHRPLLVKIDVQGSESEVLQGLTEVLGRADAVLVEVSFADVYVGQSDASDVIQTMLDAGFALSGIARVPGSRPTWTLDQADLFFERR